MWFFFFLPPKRGQRGRRDETHPAAPAWLGPLSPPGEGRPGFPLSPALKGQWPVRGAGRWGETRRRSHALSEGEESTLEGERGRPCSPQWALPEKRRLFAICRAAPPGKEEKRERPREQAAASRGRLWFFFFLPPKRGQRGRRDETHPAAPAWLGPLSPPGEGRPGFPLSLALKGRWPIRGAGRWGEMRGRSPALSGGEESGLCRPCPPGFAHRLSPGERACPLAPFFQKKKVGGPR